MGDETTDIVPDLRRRPRRPRAIYMVALAYLCVLGFFAGGGSIHEPTALFLFAGFWLWLIGGISSTFDMTYPERHRSGVVALVAAITLGLGFWFAVRSFAG